MLFVSWQAPNFLFYALNVLKIADIMQKWNKMRQKSKKDLQKSFRTCIFPPRELIKIGRWSSFSTEA